MEPPIVTGAQSEWFQSEVRGSLWGESSFLVMKSSEKRAYRRTDDANKHSDSVLLQSFHAI